MKEYTVRRVFRDSEFLITVKNPDGKQKGVTSITVDGNTIEGNIISAVPGKHVVEVIL